MYSPNAMILMSALARLEDLRGGLVSGTPEPDEVDTALELCRRGYMQMVPSEDAQLRVMLTSLGRAVVRRARAAA